MIRNIIFDMVGVLMRFDTESYIEEHHLSDADVAILRKEVTLLPGMGDAGQRRLFLRREAEGGAYATECRRICVLPYMICSTGKAGKSSRSKECGSCCRI